jgi:hypothetical protein
MTVIDDSKSIDDRMQPISAATPTFSVQKQHYSNIGTDFAVHVANVLAGCWVLRQVVYFIHVGGGILINRETKDESQKFES